MHKVKLNKKILDNSIKIIELLGLECYELEGIYIKYYGLLQQEFEKYEHICFYDCSFSTFNRLVPLLFFINSYHGNEKFKICYNIGLNSSGCSISKNEIKILEWHETPQDDDDLKIFLNEEKSHLENTYDKNNIEILKIQTCIIYVLKELKKDDIFEIKDWISFFESVLLDCA